jgi:cytochrome c oxidase subunit 2
VKRGSVVAVLLVVAALLVCSSVSVAAAGQPERVIQITAKRFEFQPATIELKVGVPVVLEIRALDRKHGLASPELHIDAVIVPGKPTRVRIVPDQAGTFSFHCSVFCGHEDMTGQIVVTP